MQLTMTVLRCPDSVAPETRNVSGGEFSVGRGPGVDWVLPDPERLLSKRHFAVAFRAGVWQLADTSTNGTFLNREGDPIGAGDVRSLRDGDRLRLGAYEIEVRLVEEAARPAARSGSSPFADPFAMDPFGPARPERNPFDEPDHPSLRIGPTSAQLPHDYDPMAPEPRETPFRGPTQADNSPVAQDAFHLAGQVGQMPLHSGGVIPGDDVLPDDWDKDLLEGIAPTGGAAPPSAHRVRAQCRRNASTPSGSTTDRTSGAVAPPRAAPPRGAGSGCRRWRAARGVPRGRRHAGCAADGSAGDHAGAGQGVPKSGRRTARRADRTRPRSRANSASSRR